MTIVRDMREVDRRRIFNSLLRCFFLVNSSYRQSRPEYWRGSGNCRHKGRIRICDKQLDEQYQMNPVVNGKMVEFQLKVVVQPAPSADLSGVVFSLSNPNVSPHVTGQTRTLQFLQIVKLQFFNTKYIKNMY